MADRPLHIAFKREPVGKARLRLTALVHLDAESAQALADELTEEEMSRWARDVLDDLIEHLCINDDDCLALAASVALSYLLFDRTEAGNGRP